MDNSYPGLAGYFPMEEIHRSSQGNIVSTFTGKNFGTKGSEALQVKIDRPASDIASSRKRNLSFAVFTKKSTYKIVRCTDLLYQG